MLKVISLLFLRFGGAILSFSTGLLIAKFYGVQASGVYYLFLSFLMGFALLSKFGLENTLIRKCGAMKESESDEMHSLILAANIICVALALMIIALLSICGEILLRSFFNSVPVEEVLFYLTIAIIPMGLLGINIATLRGRRMFKSASLLENVILPGSVLVLIGINLILGTGSLLDVVKVYAGAVFFAFFVSALLCYKWSLAGVSHLKLGSFSMLSYAWPLFGLALATYLMSSIATLFLAFYMSEADVGVFNVCNRFVLLAGSVLLVFNNINSPEFSKLNSNNDNVGLEALSRRTSTVCAGVSLMVVVGTILFGKILLGLFGEDFLVGYSVLVILVIGQFVTMSFGSVGYLLIMTGNAVWHRNVIIFGVIFLSVSMYFLIPRFGVIGAAISMSSGLALNNVLAGLIAKKKLNINVMPDLRLIPVGYKYLRHRLKR